MSYHKNSLNIKISTISVAKIFDWVGGQNANDMQWRHQKFSKGGIVKGQSFRRMEGQKPGPVCVAHNHDCAKGGDPQPKVMKFFQNV